MKEKFLKLGVLIAVLAVVSLAVAGVSAAVTVSTTYYISDDGTGTGNGTETNPINASAFFEKLINGTITLGETDTLIIPADKTVTLRDAIVKKVIAKVGKNYKNVTKKNLGKIIIAADDNYNPKANNSTSDGRQSLALATQFLGGNIILANDVNVDDLTTASGVRTGDNALSYVPEFVILKNSVIEGKSGLTQNPIIGGPIVIGVEHPDEVKESSLSPIINNLDVTLKNLRRAVSSENNAIELCTKTNLNIENVNDITGSIPDNAIEVKAQKIKFFGDEKEINKKIVRSGGIGSVININNSNLNAATDGIKVEAACVININPKSNINFGDSEDGKYALFKADYGTNKDSVSDGLIHEIHTGNLAKINIIEDESTHLSLLDRLKNKKVYIFKNFDNSDIADQNEIFITDNKFKVLKTFDKLKSTIVSQQTSAQTTTTKSPFPLFGILAGLGVAAVLIKRRH